MNRLPATPVPFDTVSALLPRPPQPPAKTFCEFFAGIGLIREGLHHSGWSCCYANDIDPKKRQLYEARFGAEGHFHLADINCTTEVTDLIHGTPFLATASFPCTDLSLAGHYRGLVAGEHSSAFFGFASVLEALGTRKPRVVLLENVPGFLTSRQGGDFAIAARRLAALGYCLDVVVLDARHFTPQSRPRVFLFAVAPDLLPTVPEVSAWFGGAEAPTDLRTASVLNLKQQLCNEVPWVKLPIPNPPPRSVQLLEVLDLDDQQEWWNDSDRDRHYGMMSAAHRRTVDALVRTGERWVGTIFRRIRQQAMRAEVRFDGLAGCLRTPRGGSAKQIVVAVTRGKLWMRWMTPREYARLQGAPDFPLVGTTIQQLWGFGDAVCVPAIRWLDEHVLTPLYLSAQSGVRLHS